MTSSLKLVLFDMEEVLSRYDRATRIARLSHITGKTLEAACHAIWGSGLEACVDAGNTLFIDDSDANVMGAIAGSQRRAPSHVA